MVELRKRKAAPAPPIPAKKQATTKKVSEPTKANTKTTDDTKVEESETPVEKTKVEGKTQSNGDTVKSTPPVVGDIVDLDGFGGDIETHDGKKVTLKQLVDESKAGVLLFTYPKANTPGCTVQACAFRDGHDFLTSGGLMIYGLSGDSPKSNTSFKTKQSLPYTLLCNPSYSLIGAIGLQQGTASKTKRGVFAVDKTGKVLLQMAGGPKPTVDAAQKLVNSLKD